MRATSLWKKQYLLNIFFQGYSSAASHNSVPNEKSARDATFWKNHETSTVSKLTSKFMVPRGSKIFSHSRRHDVSLMTVQPSRSLHFHGRRSSPKENRSFLVNDHVPFHECTPLYIYIGLVICQGDIFISAKLKAHLNKASDKPHNPMINAGGIVVASLIKNNLRLADRFDFVSNQYRKLAGGGHVGFNNAIFLSERESADRNFALGYFLKEKRCFPDGINLHETMDFYFQLCSIEVTCESGAVLAASLANGGYCPITGEQVLDPLSVRNTLALMHSCGMYDYSGEFAFKVGLPAKSGVSGLILLVVPNVCGMAIWSPPLDVSGNSVRGIQFCEELVQLFNFHHYDNLKHKLHKYDPRIRRSDVQGSQVVKLLFGAYNGDLTALRRMALADQDMSIADYDGRTALHLAAAEGQLDCVQFLLEKCSVPPNPKDRWGHTPLDDAVHFKRQEVSRYLRQHLEAHPDTSAAFPAIPTKQFSGLDDIELVQQATDRLTSDSDSEGDTKT